MFGNPLSRGYWKGLLGQVPPDLGPFGELARLHRGIATDLVPALRARANAVDLGGAEGQIQALSNQLSGRESELVQILRESVARRDSGTYEDAYGALVDLCARSAIVATRRTLLGALEPVASVWADQIRSRTGAHGLPDPPGAPDLAWRWKQLVQELDRRGSRSPMELQRNIEDLRNRLEHLTAELIDRRAWAAQVQRVGVRERQALIGWLQTMKKIGKGTGKRAPQLMAEARRQMSQCRNAVPVWIMPLARVVENFDPRATRFDVVVIDEASQSDIMAMIALYFGKQVLVVGDEEQVSPDAVGQNLTAIGQLIAQYLRDVPNGHLYDGQTSIYDLAKASFGGTILLREHFRCVPEIIQFSNALSYDWRLKPLRDASHVVVKPPLVAHRVAGHDDGRNVNLEEALTTATLIAAASEQPEYESTTFGVISLVGEQQAIEIDRLLRTYLSPVEYERRRILCGNPAHFQGDERDVMFLSVVDGPRSTSLPLRDQPLFKKRFNVAASRARDQMWLIYSLNPSTDLKPGDLRRRLIQHALDPTDLMTQLERVESAAESEFERQVAQRLVTAGYSVTPQWPVGYYRIDLVVGNGGSRLAIECDGDRFHPLEKLPEDMERQAILERLGWTFVRLRGSEYFRSPDAAMGSVFQRLADMGITPQDRDVPAIPSEEDDVRARVIRRAAEIRRDWEENPSGARGGNDSGHGWVDPTVGRSEVLDSESAADYGQGAQGPRAGPTGMRDAVPSQISGPPVLDSPAIQDRGFDGITALYKTIAEKYGCAEASVRFQLGRDGKPPGPRWAPLWEWRPSLRDRDGDAAQVLWLAVLKLLADGWYARVMEAPTVSAGQTVTRELVEQLERVDASKAEPTPGSQPLALDAAFEGGTARELFNRAPEPASAAFQEQPAQSSDLAPFLRARGIPFVDQRHKGGRFWLVGGSELNDLITEMRGKGLIFQAAPRPKATGRKPGWWLESGDTYTVDEAADENDSKST